MTLEIIATFSLLDNNGNKVSDAKIGTNIKESDLEFSIQEKYEELRSELCKQSGLIVVDKK